MLEVWYRAKRFALLVKVDVMLWIEVIQMIIALVGLFVAVLSLILS